MMKKLKTELFLLLAPVLWAGGIVALKSLVEVISPSWMTAIRFSMGALVMLPILWKRRDMISKKTMISGLIIAFLLYIHLVIQVYGLQTADAGVSTFLMSFYVVATPFFEWILLKRTPKRNHLIGVLLAIVGIALISMHGAFRIERGEALALVVAVIVALMFVVTEKIAGNEDAMSITGIQIVGCALFSLISAVVLDNPPENLQMHHWWVLLFLGIFVSGFSYIIQNVGLSIVQSSHASIVFSTESVFAMIFGMVILGERAGIRVLLGCVMMFVAILISLKQS